MMKTSKKGSIGQALALCDPMVSKKKKIFFSMIP